LRDYTPETESFRDDAMALLNGVAVTIAVMGMWTKPVFMGLIGLVVAVFAYLMSPRSRGGTVMAVMIITLIALIETWWLGHSLA
jgi:hypothetical protein